MTSYQTSYSGQKGWNDCPPTSFISPTSTPSSSVTSLQSQLHGSKSIKPTVISAMSVAPPPPSRSSSIVSIPGVPATSSGTTSPYSTRNNSTAELNDSPSTSTNTSSSSSTSLSETNVNVETVQILLAQVLQLPTSISTREYSHYKTRLEKNIPTLDQPHLDVVNFVCENTLGLVPGGSYIKARDVIVQHMLVHTGIASWALPLRKIVESINIE